MSPEEEDYSLHHYEDPHEPSAWAKWNRRLLFIIFFCLAVISWRLFVPELKRSHEIDTELAGIRAELKREEDAKRDLSEQVYWLRDSPDPAYLETIARDILHAAKPGETVVHLESIDPRNVRPNPVAPAARPAGE